MSAELTADREPRPERATTPDDLARELGLARERSGLTVRQVAKAAGIPVSTAGDYFAGRHLPSATQPETLRKIVRACGISDLPAIEAWVTALSRVRRVPGRRSSGAPVPYRGLAAFEAEDAEWFFGRDDLISLLADAVGDGPLGIPVTVTGPSGSGKSSLLRAGLIPLLEARPDGSPDRWRIGLMTPGSAPAAALAKQVADLAGPGRPAESADWGGRPDSAGPPQRRALIVDQLEEIFTSCPDEAERHDFVAALSDLAGEMLVVLGIRADFYGHALRYRSLAASLQKRQIVVGPMTREQLSEAISEPARRARLTLDPGLADLLISDLAPAAGYPDPEGSGPEAGALPLLSHALRSTWERAKGSQLTVADYQAAGGIRNAIAYTAEAAYEALGEADRELARRLFLCLVHVSDDLPLARARVPLDELPGHAPGHPGDGGVSAATEVLARFVDERLVTLDEHGAQLTHEALLSAWPRLRQWISDDQDGLKIRQRIVSAAAVWQESGRDDAVLLRGAPLTIAADWAARAASMDSLSPLARDFVDASVADQRTRNAAERRRVRRLRQLSAGLAATTLLAGLLSAYAFQQRRSVAVARDLADSREVAVEAEQLRGEDPSLAAQLSLAAYRISHTRGALASLLESASYPMAARLRDSASVVQSVALAPDRTALAVASADGTLRAWNLSRPGHPVPLGRPMTPQPGSALYAAAFSPDGRVLAAAGAARKIYLFNAPGPDHLVPLGEPLTGPANTVYSLAFSPRGQLLAAGSADDTVRLWNVANPSHPAPAGTPLTGPSGYVEAVAFSPDGTILAAASADQTIWLWNVSDPVHPVRLGHPLAGPANTVDAVTFSPDGHTLAAGSRDGTVRTWNISDPARPVAASPLPATDWVNAVAYSPDGQILAAATSGNQVQLWNAASGAPLGTLPSPQPVTSLAWDGNAELIAGEDDGVVRLWTVPPPMLLGNAPANQVSFSPDGKTLAAAGADLRLLDSATRRPLASVTVPRTPANTVSWAPSGTLLAAGYYDGNLRLWHDGPAGLTAVGKPVPATSTGIVEFVAFRRDGRVLATAGDDGTVRLWDMADPASPRPIAVIHDAGSSVFSVAFSPDGNLLAAASVDNLTRLWDVSDPAHPRLVGRPLAGTTSYDYSVAFSPDGKTLAVGSADKTVHLWNVTDPARPHLESRPLTGPGGFVYSLAFSPDGHTLAAGVTDGTVWLWAVRNLARPVLITHVADATFTTFVYSVAFAPDGATLAAASSDGTVRLWPLRAAAAAARLCATAGQPLTRSEWRSYVPGRPYQPPCRG